MNKKKYDIKKEDIYQYYIIDQKSTYDISLIYGCHRVLISRYLKKYGIPTRRKDGKSGERFRINKKYFKYFSENMAYIVGLLGADGCVLPKKYTISIKSIDYELLEFIQQELNMNYSIRENYDNRKICYSLNFYGKEIIDDLQLLGICPRKSLIFNLPPIPDEYFWDFLRGYIDGDGSIGKYKAGSKMINLYITGSNNFITQLLPVLIDKIDYKNYNFKNYHISSAGRAKTLSISGPFAYKILQRCYLNDKFALTRKKEKAIYNIEQYSKIIKENCERCGKEIINYLKKRKYCKECGGNVK